MRSPIRLSAVAALALSLAACGGGSILNGDAGPTAIEACGDQANAVCALRDSCSPGFGVTRLFGTLALCESRTAQTCVNALAATGTGNSPAHVEACAAAYPGEGCSDFFDANPVGACVPQMGTQAIGAACGAAAQCTTGYCAVAQYAVCGTCQALPVVGAACEVQADCGRDLACAIPTVAGADGGVPTSGSCAAFATSGGACLTGFQPCESGLGCVGDNPTTMTTGICHAQGATIGATCDGSRQTGPNCNGNLGLVCVPAARGSSVGTCQTIQLVAAGAVCGNIGSAPITGFAECANGGLCKKAVSTDPTGVCVAPATDAAGCDNSPGNGPPCLSPAKCVIPSGSSGTAGTCITPNASICH